MNWTLATIKNFINFCKFFFYKNVEIFIKIKKFLEFFEILDFLKIFLIFENFENFWIFFKFFKFLKIFGFFENLWKNGFFDFLEKKIFWPKNFWKFSFSKGFYCKIEKNRKFSRFFHFFKITFFHQNFISDNTKKYFLILF